MSEVLNNMKTRRSIRKFNSLSGSRCLLILESQEITRESAT